MRGLKVVVPFAACGFLLSFVAGLFSHSSFLSVLIKALIFAIVFALLGFVISMVFGKFLSDGMSEFQSDASEGGSSSGVQSSPLGHNVDITIQDEELEKSESENHFVVSDSHQMLNESDVKNIQKESDPERPGFVPLRNFETVKNFSGTEAATPDLQNLQEENPQPVSQPRSSSPDEDELDTLPEMENFAFGEDSGSDSGSDIIASSGTSDSEFVSSGSRKQEEPEVKDAALMAKAISSVLSDEDAL